VSKRALLALAPGIFLVLAGCSASGGATQSGNDAASCKVNAKALCQSLRNAPVTELETGITADFTRRAQTSNKTATILMHYPLKSGTSFGVECYINTETSAVVYAKAFNGMTLSPEDAEELRSHGGCEQ
jgi:pyridoxine 5'-phosphate synthase PdxJ